MASKVVITTSLVIECTQMCIHLSQIPGIRFLPVITQTMQNDAHMHSNMKYAVDTSNFAVYNV